MDGAKRYTFKHSERLKFRKQIETLFQNGEAFSVYPFRVVYRISKRMLANDAPARIGFSVPKKKMRHAVQRNRIKRLAKEAWRQNKHQVYPSIPDDIQLHLFMIFTGKDLPDWTIVQKAVSKMMPILQSINYTDNELAG